MARQELLGLATTDRCIRAGTEEAVVESGNQASAQREMVGSKPATVHCQ